jgi:hypothetical protein
MSAEMALDFILVKVYLSIERSRVANATAKRLMDLAEAHIGNAGNGGFSSRDLAAEVAIKSAPKPGWLLLPPRGDTETVSLLQLGAGVDRRAPIS